MYEIGVRNRCQRPISCDQDGRMEPWKSFKLNESEYKEIEEWWLSNHSGVSVNDLGASNWEEWQTVIIEDEE